MQTTQLPTWCCHQEDDDDLFQSDDQDSDPVMQENTEEGLKDYNEFPKPDAVKTRDDLNDLDNRRVTNLTTKESVAFKDDDEEGDDEESDEEDKKAAQDCHPVHSEQVYSCHSVCLLVIMSRIHILQINKD